jgi:hypothetical protein
MPWIINSATVNETQKKRAEKQSKQWIQDAVLIKKAIDP